MYIYLCKARSLANDIHMLDIKAISSEDEIDLLTAAMAEGWISVRSSECFITRSGLDALQAEEDERDSQRKREAYEAAKQAEADARSDQQLKKQFKHDWLVAIFSSLASFVLGLIAQHFLDVVGGAARAWGSLFH